MIGCDDSIFNRGKVLSLEVFGLAGRFGGVECYKVTKRAKMLLGVCYERGKWKVNEINKLAEFVYI